VSEHGSDDAASCDAGVPSDVCSACGADLLYSARARGNGLCGPCTRARARPPRLTDAEAHDLATMVVAAPSGEVPREIGRLADKVLELLARVPHDGISPLLAPQPPPANPPRGPAIWPLVIAEAEAGGEYPRLIALMRARDAQGRAKYGVPLCANDGRDTAMDALQEVLDLRAYLRKGKAEGRSCPHYWERNISDIAIALIDEIEGRKK
jgi:hypothetical protein